MSNPEIKWEEATPIPVGSELDTSAAVDAVPDTPEQQSNDLLAAALTIFENGGTKFTLQDGFEAEIYPAKMKQMAPTMRFFHQVVGSLETSQLATLIDVVGKKQKEYLAEGKDPRTIDIKELVSSDVISDAFGNASIISLLFSAAFDYLPGFVKLFTNIPEEKYGDLDFDEGVIVVVGIFVLNYHFFTQRLLPLLTGSIRLLAKQNAKSGAAGVKKMLTQATR